MLVNLLGLLAIGLVVWWFWFYKPVTVSVSNSDIIIIADSGSYTLAHLTLPANKPTTLTFLRKDESPCAGVVMIPSLDINQTLPLNQAITVDLPGLAAGQYPFYCQMQMYRGMLNIN